MFDIEAMIVGWVVSVHSSDLRESSKYLRFARQLEKYFVWFCGRRVEGDFSESSCGTFGGEVFSPCFKGVTGSFFREVREGGW